MDRNILETFSNKGNATYEAQFVMRDAHGQEVSRVDYAGMLEHVPTQPEVVRMSPDEQDRLSQVLLDEVMVKIDELNWCN